MLILWSMFPSKWFQSDVRLDLFYQWIACWFFHTAILIIYMHNIQCGIELYSEIRWIANQVIAIWEKFFDSKNNDRQAVCLVRDKMETPTAFDYAAKQFVPSVFESITVVAAFSPSHFSIFLFVGALIGSHSVLFGIYQSVNI